MGRHARRRGKPDPLNLLVSLSPSLLVFHHQRIPATVDDPTSKLKEQPECSSLHLLSAFPILRLKTC
jgi:hypothetical protein